MTLTVDDQPYRRPKPPAMNPISFRPLVVDPIPEPETVEIPMSAWLELDGWQDTERLDLSELRSD